MAGPVEHKLPLRHPAEIPMFILLVFLNFVILAFLIDFLATATLIPAVLRGTGWETLVHVVAGAIVLVAPALMVVRQVQRASIRGTAVQLSRTQFADLYASVDDFASPGRGAHPGFVSHQRQRRAQRLRGSKRMDQQLRRAVQRVVRESPQ
jgi:hypothetical protein